MCDVLATSGLASSSADFAVLAVPVGSDRDAPALVAMGELLGQDADTLAICRSAIGRPTLLMPQGVRWLSLSRAGRLLLLGTGKTPVGVDFEPLGSVREPAWNVLHPGERAALTEIGDPAARHRGFLRLWTAKEAYLKAIGLGLRREPCEIAIVRDGSGWTRGVEGEQPLPPFGHPLPRSGGGKGRGHVAGAADEARSDKDLSTAYAFSVTDGQHVVPMAAAFSGEIVLDGQPFVWSACMLANEGPEIRP